MNTSSYRDRDHAFGEAVLTLRSKIGLTQVELAQRLGISRRAVSAWEAGSSYPKVEMLKKLVTLAIEQHAFPSGQEISQVRGLWVAAHHKVAPDEAWLNALLNRSAKKSSMPFRAKEPTWGVSRRSSMRVPAELTAFVGRAKELAEISGLLGEPGCRLLTLVGPGGIGKTRLAIRAAGKCEGLFEDGVYFVPLQSLDSQALIGSAILDVVNPQFGQGSNFKQQLVEHLRERALLLVLDNFEHLLEGADLLTELLEAAPNIKVLATSRQVLNLKEEWRYPVRGLEYPETEDIEEPESFSAVQLFVARARQVRNDLSLKDEQAAIIRVCQLVEGMPLALELAAAWARALPTNEIVVEIQRSLDFLSTSLRNVPERHKSMQAIFEETWRRLTEQERHVFGALSVFRGGFRREAAGAVANVSVAVLSGLADKSLLTLNAEGRYQIHELLRQYAQARLEATSEAAIQIHERHAAYYTGFLHERDSDLNAQRQRKASKEVEAEIDNVRAAWSWSVDHARVEYIDTAAHPLMLFYQYQSRFPEGSDAFEKAVQLLDSGDPANDICLAKALCGLGWMAVRWGAFMDAQAAFERSWSLYSQHGVLPTPGGASDPRPPLGLAYIRLGNINAAETLGQEALRDHTLRQDHFNLALACYLLSSTARVRGHYAEARHYAQEGYRHTVVSGDELFAPFCLHEWGKSSQLLGDMVDAKRRLEASYAIRKEFADTQGMAMTLNSLGRLALIEGNNAEARRCYEEALLLYYDLGEKGGMASSLEGLGDAARESGYYGEARRYLREALQHGSKPISLRTLSIFVGIGELFLETGERARGIELTALALRHPAADRATKDRASALLNRHPDYAEAARQVSAETNLEVVISALIDELQYQKNDMETHHSSATGETLIEPLSERELAVLTLVAGEQSNREIADTLFISVATVKWYLTHIYSKLGVQNRSIAVERARELNLLPQS